MTSEIRPARWPEDLDVVRQLFGEYAAGLEVDLGYQGFAQELASLPGKYAPPHGRLLLGWRGDEPLGCVALRPLQDGDCEMKRLYVRSSARGEHLGRRLVDQLCSEASAAGYRRICLDTLASMHAAHALYLAIGFSEIAAYGNNPVAGTRYFARVLTAMT